MNVIVRLWFQGRYDLLWMRPDLVGEWTSQKERSNPFILRLICFIALKISRGFARLLLWPITLYFFLSSPLVRFSSRQYLKRVPGHHGNIWEVIRHIHNFSATVLDRVYFLTNQFDRFNIRIHDEEQLDEVLPLNKGAIILGAHVGSFDALRCLALRYKQIPIKVLMYQDHNAMITQVLDELNPEVSASVINLANPTALLEMKEVLEQGGVVGMLGDRLLEGEKSVTCTFLGDEIRLPIGPFSIAEILGVPVIGVFGIYAGGNQYEICHSLLYDGQKVSREQRSESIASLTQKYANTIEGIVKHSPYNWFNFYDYWGDD